MMRGSSPTVSEGVYSCDERPPLRSGYYPALAALIVLSSAVILASCNAGMRRSGIPAGAQGVLDTAIQDIDAGRYDKLYQEASDEWRNQSTLEASRVMFEKISERLGRARTRSLVTAREEQTGTAPVAGHSVTVVYQTSFDRGEGMEIYTLVEHGGRWYLAKYFVSSSGK